RRDDQLVTELVVRDRLLRVLVHRLRVVPVVDVVLRRLSTLPDAAPLDREPVVLGPRHLRLEDDLALVLAVVRTLGAVRLDRRRRHVGIAARPEAVAVPRRHLRRLRWNAET